MQKLVASGQNYYNSDANLNEFLAFCKVGVSIFFKIQFFFSADNLMQTLPKNVSIDKAKKLYEYMITQLDDGDKNFDQHSQ